MGSNNYAGPWIAGEASLADPSLAARAAALGGRALNLLGEIAVKAPLSILLGVLYGHSWQLAGEWYRDREAAPVISAMKAEQAFMVGKGLASPRRIGVLAGPEYNFTMEGRVSFSAETRVLRGTQLDLLSFEAGIADLLEKTGFPRLSDNPRAISVGQPGKEDIVRDMAEYVYRHEDAHGRAHEKNLSFSAPPSWTPQSAAIVSAAMSSPYSASDGSWRGQLLSGLWGEAFADARACLMAASHGPDALADCALTLHRYRIFPNANNPRTFNSLIALGGDHNVDSASFIAGQFDENAVAALDAQGLDELASKVADASVAWLLAREAPGLRFFDGQGRSWWMESAMKAGLPDDQAERAWLSLKKDCLSATPHAAFGAFSWHVQGKAFSARGLDPSLAKHWRFDGFGASLIAGSSLDRTDKDGTAPPSAWMSSVVTADPQIRAITRAFDPYHIVDSSKRFEAFNGAARTHAALIKRIPRGHAFSEREDRALVAHANSMESIAGSGLSISAKPNKPGR